MRRGNLLTALFIAACVLGIASCCSRSCPTMPTYETYPPIDRQRSVSRMVWDTIHQIEDTCRELLYPPEYVNYTSHDKLELGDNEISPDGITFATDNAKIIDHPKHPSLMLDSQVGASCAVFHFDSFHLYDVITSVEVLGSRCYDKFEDNGLYIGVRQGSDLEFDWYGPYRYKGVWNLEYTSVRMHLRGGGTPSIAFAVANGDKFEAERVRIRVEDSRKIAEDYRWDLYWDNYWEDYWEDYYERERELNDINELDDARDAVDDLERRNIELKSRIDDLEDKIDDLVGVDEPEVPVEPEEPEEPVQPVVKAVPVL